MEKEARTVNCRRCGLAIPDRFWNPYYCWECRRQRNTRFGITSACIVSFLIMGLAVNDWLVTGIFALVVGVPIIWATFKQTKPKKLSTVTR